jgi:hypothetical protein
MRIQLSMLILIFLASCNPQPISNPPPTPTSLPTNMEPIPATPDHTQEKMIALAVEDLSTRRSLDLKQIHVISVESVKWPDAALGCPRPGEAYAEQAEAGYRIVLEANGQNYIYHTDRAGRIILCLEAEVKPDEAGLR